METQGKFTGLLTVKITLINNGNYQTYHFCDKLEAKNFYFNKKAQIDAITDIDDYSAKGKFYKIELL